MDLDRVTGSSLRQVCERQTFWEERWIWLFKEESGSTYFWCQNGALLVEGRSKFQDLSYWIWQQSKLLKYPTGQLVVIISRQADNTLCLQQLGNSQAIVRQALAGNRSVEGPRGHVGPLRTLTPEQLLRVNPLHYCIRLRSVTGNLAGRYGQPGGTAASAS